MKDDVIAVGQLTGEDLNGYRLNVNDCVGARMLNRLTGKRCSWGSSSGHMRNSHGVWVRVGSFDRNGNNVCMMGMRKSSTGKDIVFKYI